MWEEWGREGSEGITGDKRGGSWTAGGKRGCRELREEGVTPPINFYWQSAAELGAGAGAGPEDASDPTPPGERERERRVGDKKKY